MVQTGPIVRISSPSFSRRARPRSTASATAMACGKVKETVALMLTPRYVHSSMAAIRPAWPNLDDHVGRQPTEMDGLFTIAWLLR